MFRLLVVTTVKQMIYLWPSIIRQLTVYEATMMQLMYSYREITEM